MNMLLKRAENRDYAIGNMLVCQTNKSKKDNFESFSETKRVHLVLFFMIFVFFMFEITTPTKLARNNADSRKKLHITIIENGLFSCLFSIFLFSLLDGSTISTSLISCFLHNSYIFGTFLVIFHFAPAIITTRAFSLNCFVK